MGMFVLCSKYFVRRKRRFCRVPNAFAGRQPLLGVVLTKGKDYSPALVAEVLASFSNPPHSLGLTLGGEGFSVPWAEFQFQGYGGFHFRSERVFSSGV